MPHYKDGTEAKIGDLVKGKPYNTEGVVVGTVIGITANQESCNLRVGFLEATPLARPPARMAIPTPLVHRDPDGNSSLLVIAVDYGETKAFELLHRPSALTAEQETANRSTPGMSLGG